MDGRMDGWMDRYALRQTQSVRKPVRHTYRQMVIQNVRNTDIVRQTYTDIDRQT
jgi:hypothetical protein